MAVFSPLSSFVIIMFLLRLFARLCGLNPGSPGASKALVVILALFQLTFLLTSRSNGVSLVS